MSHQCVRCGKFYEDVSEEILKGCTCGSHFFFFIKKEEMKQIKEEQIKPIDLTLTKRKEIEEDIREIIGPDIDLSKPVILDLESIRIKKPGQFEIDLVSLFKRKPLVYRLEDGKYYIDIATTFQLKKNFDEVQPNYNKEETEE
ncbi:hypothetical protein CO154_00850 [Candidatus Pacearchaeota archaeon CG_4_9_14_3_um_filter_31_7]|nr:MAG: hypothetical protein CO154_00850 [Candidatus Pacearchaeota archaeon CG_4_9_14_3_um_filter_31_7]